jgi:hypothetical protein
MNKDANQQIKTKEKAKDSKTFASAFKDNVSSSDGSNLVEVLHRVRKSEFVSFIGKKQQNSSELLKLEFYFRCERDSEDEVETILSHSKARAFKSNAGEKLQRILTTSLPKSFLGSKSFSRLMDSLFEWSLAVDKMTNTIVKSNFYVLDFTDDIQVKPSSESKYTKINFELTKKDTVILMILQSIRFIIKHVALSFPFNGQAKSALKSFAFVLLTSSIGLPKSLSKVSIDSLASRMAMPSILFLFKFFEKYISGKIIDMISEKEAEMYAQTIVAHLQTALEFMIRVKVKLDELFHEYMSVASDRREEFRASECKILTARLIEAFLLNKEASFEAFDSILISENLEMIPRDNGWMIVQETD